MVTSFGSSRLDSQTTTMKDDFFLKINNGWIFNTNVGKRLSHITLGPQNLSNKNTKVY